MGVSFWELTSIRSVGFITDVNLSFTKFYLPTILLLSTCCRLPQVLQQIASRTPRSVRNSHLPIRGLHNPLGFFAVSCTDTIRYSKPLYAHHYSTKTDTPYNREGLEASVSINIIFYFNNLRYISVHYRHCWWNGRFASYSSQLASSGVFAQRPNTSPGSEYSVSWRYETLQPFCSIK